MSARSVFVFTLVCAGMAQASAENVPFLNVHRCDANPIIQARKGVAGLDNVNGPSMIRVPSWVSNPLGKYYLYFAHHQGRAIHLAYADRVCGPWKIHGRGILSLEKASSFSDHIASPDAHVDERGKRILLYFHGGPEPQRTGLAISRDGTSFRASGEIIGPPYFRRFSIGGRYYGIASGESGLVFLKGEDPEKPFEEHENRPELLPKARHSAVWIKDGRGYIFFSRIGDAPERILVSTFNSNDDWSNWTASKPVEVLKPEMTYEGASLPIEKSKSGMSRENAHQLRDPDIFEDEGTLYLLYSIAGEAGIAAAVIDIATLN